MGLNIKNERVHALAKEAAAKTGLTQTGAIERALEQFLAAFQDDPQRIIADRADALRTLSVEFRQDLTTDQLGMLSTEDLYDDGGLPA
jgi:antitoxin VapB